MPKKPGIAVAVKEKKKRSTNYSRTKGHGAERVYAKVWREEFLFEHCRTARLASRLLDNCNVDLAHIPALVQIKKGYATRYPKFDRIFKEMKDDLKKNFPPTDAHHAYPKILIHEIDGYKDEHIGVTMMLRDWKEVYKGYLENQRAKGLLPPGTTVIMEEEEEEPSNQ